MAHILVGEPVSTSPGYALGRAGVRFRRGGSAWRRGELAATLASAERAFDLPGVFREFVLLEFENSCIEFIFSLLVVFHAC